MNIVIRGLSFLLATLTSISAAVYFFTDNIGGAISVGFVLLFGLLTLAEAVHDT